MRCQRCGYDYPAGVVNCPNCGEQIHYGGNTVFFGKVVSAKLTVKDIFSDVTKKHTREDGAKIFIAGTPLTTPTPDRMLDQWQKPWLFARVLGFGLIFVLLCWVMSLFGHPGGAVCLWSIGVLIIPLSLLLMFWEMNIPRDIPLYTLLTIFVIGGMLSLIITMVLGMFNPISAVWAAPITEEPAKLLMAIIFMRLLNTKYGFSGLLIGAAVGTGFACFETLYYVMYQTLIIKLSDMGITLGQALASGAFTTQEEFMEVFSYMLNNAMSAATENAIARSILSPGMHIPWATMYCCALALAKGSEPLQLKHFMDKRFLTNFGIAVFLHFAWNGGLGLFLPQSLGDLIYFGIPYVGGPIHWVLIVAALFSVYQLLLPCISQVLAVTDIARVADAAQNQPTFGSMAIVGLVGPHKNCVFGLESGMVTIGRDPQTCGIVLPQEAAGVSRRHCTVAYQNGTVYLMDHGSSHGTYLHSGERLAPEQWVVLNGPFYLGSNQITYAVGQRDS